MLKWGRWWLWIVERYSALDAAALAVKDAKCGKAASEVGSVRSAATEAKKQQTALRDRVNESMMKDRAEILAKNKRVAEQREEQAKVNMELAKKQCETLDKIATSLPQAKRARQDASNSQLLMVIVAGSKRTKFSDKMKAMYDKVEEKVIERCVIDLADSDDENDEGNNGARAESVGQAGSVG
ncbi:hypothetical protein CYMTET_42024 [Cymbomonas tetramitiformis]|uniref:Uncharacterized protein n=1 Tax=Cymbomonas tetramitiformis TaxID=36881 RepID=A0AAE0F224_9CHLO|nr:hypothetical protein CYMTET_42024 [Cymbomonas tetramitiformis]